MKRTHELIQFESEQSRKFAPHNSNRQPDNWTSFQPRKQARFEGRHEAQDAAPKGEAITRNRKSELEREPGTLRNRGRGESESTTSYFLRIMGTLWSRKEGQPNPTSPTKVPLPIQGPELLAKWLKRPCGKIDRESMRRRRPDRM